MRGYVNAVRAVVGMFALVTLRGKPAQSLRPELLVDRRYTGENSNTPLSYATTALLGRDTLVYALDKDNGVIHVAKGAAQVRLMSRKGRGPGEMQRPQAMAFLGDSIALPDATLARVTIFSLRSRTVRTVDLPPTTGTGYYGVYPMAYGRSAVVLLGSGTSVPQMAGLNGTRSLVLTDDVGLFVRRHGSARLDTLALLTRGITHLSIPSVLRGQSAIMSREQPFTTAPTWDVAREGGGVVVLETTGHSASTVTVRVRPWNNDGQLARTCTLERKLTPLSNSAYEAGIRSFEPPPPARALVTVDMAAARRLVIRPASLPPFRSVRLASDGTIWIRTEASFISKNEEYLVFAPTGCAAPRSLLLPLDASVEDARGHLFITSGYVDDIPAIDTWRYRMYRSPITANETASVNEIGWSR